MHISRDRMMALADIVLRVFARGVCAVSMFDRRVAADLKTLGEGFSFAVCAGMGENAPHAGLIIENGRFALSGADIYGSDVIIIFKDVSGIIPVLSGRMSVASAFAQHRILVRGNINQAVALARIIDITEAYLLPGFIIKKSMQKPPKKQAPGLFVYIMLPFCGAKEPRRARPHTGGTDVCPKPAAEAEHLNDEAEDELKAKEGLEAVK